MGTEPITEKIRYQMTDRHSPLTGYTVPTLYGKQINDWLIEPHTGDKVHLFPNASCGGLWIKLDEGSRLGKFLKKEPTCIDRMVFRSEVSKKITFIKFYNDQRGNVIEEDMGFIMNVSGEFATPLEACERIEITGELLDGL